MSPSSSNKLILLMTTESRTFYVKKFNCAKQNPNYIENDV